MPNFLENIFPVKAESYMAVKHPIQFPFNNKDNQPHKELLPHARIALRLDLLSHS